MTIRSLSAPFQQQQQHGGNQVTLVQPVQHQGTEQPGQLKSTTSLASDKQQLQQPRKIIRSVHSKHLLARAGYILGTVAATTPGAFSDKQTPLLSNNALSRRPSTFRKGMHISPEEAAVMYELSVDTEVIERFVSHSWSAPRFSKWLAMCDVHHRRFAIVCSASFWAIASLVGIGLRLGTGRPQSYASAVTAYVLAPALIFVYAFVQGPDALGSNCYFDKLCVHQGDEELKLAGINSLRDCTRVSQNLTILWSTDYFERLWCIFEIATFVASSPDIDAAMPRITLAPLWLPQFLLGLVACNVLVMLCSAAFQGSVLFPYILDALGFEAGVGAFWVITSTVPAFLISGLLRQKSSNLAARLPVLASFRLDDARVTVEEDRQIVYRQVEEMFGSLGCFEEYIRTKFYDAVVLTVGEPYSNNYAWAVIIFQPYIWYATVDVVSTSLADMRAITSLVYIIVGLFNYAAIAFVVGPLLLQGVSVGQRLSRILTGGRALLFDVFVYQTLNFLLNVGLTALCVRLADALIP